MDHPQQHPSDSLKQDISFSNKKGYTEGAFSQRQDTFPTYEKRSTTYWRIAWT
jgi:hypothetical protein